MFYLFVNHDWSPSVFFDAPFSDKLLIKHFIRKEVEEAKERSALDG
nr:MAG TPA: hypothetical protein [Caudoviricetes sp.]